CSGKPTSPPSGVRMSRGRSLGQLRNRGRHNGGRQRLLPRGSQPSAVSHPEGPSPDSAKGRAHFRAWSAMVSYGIECSLVLTLAHSDSRLLRDAGGGLLHSGGRGGDPLYPEYVNGLHVDELL